MKHEGAVVLRSPPEAYHAGTAYLQIEGCRSENIETAAPQEWIIAHHQLEIHKAASVSPRTSSPHSPDVFVIPEVTLGISRDPVVYFAIHKTHCTKPYYNATDPDYWDGGKGRNFWTHRVGPYTRFIPAACPAIY